MKKIAFIFILLSFLTKAGNPPAIIFKENKGQWPEKVLFGTEFYNVKFYANKSSFNFCIYDGETFFKSIGRNSEKTKVKGHNYEVNFVGADLSNFTKTNEQPEYYNYFLGNNKRKWASKVKAYEKLTFNTIYENIDLKLYSTNANIKYDLIVKKGGDVNSIRMNYNYTDGIELINNELIIKTSVGNVIEKEPAAFQVINGKQTRVKCKYTLLDNNSVGFMFPNGYDKNYELIIDPVVVACSYSGASVFSYNYACNYDSRGNIYNAVQSEVGYPTTMGAFQLNTNANGDCVINVFNSTGTAKRFATYFGGDSTEYPIDINVTGNAISILGSTNSKNHPCSFNAYDTILNGADDLFISKFDTSGSVLLASTLVGGSLREMVIQFSSSGYPSICGEMVLDSKGNVYVISNSTSLDFPTTAGAISNIKKGPVDAVVFKLDSVLSTLVWSTYLGGTNMEEGSSIRLDGAGGVYCSGTTNSINFPTTPGVIAPVKNGFPSGSDIYVSHIDASGTTLIASTYLGTKADDVAYLMDIDFNNSLYFCGYVSVSNSLTPSPGTYSNTNSVNSIFKINSSLTAINFQSKFGPSGSAQQQKLLYTAFKVDSCGNLYMAGMAYTGFQITPDAFQPFGGGFTDMYIAVFNPGFSSLRFATYYGGNAPPPDGYGLVGEQSYGISHFDNKGMLYLAIAASENLPTLPGAYAPTYSNTTTHARIYIDAFLKVDLKTFIHANSSYGANIYGCPPFNSHFVSSTNTGTSYWNLGDGTTSTQDTISHVYQNLGTYNVLLVVTDTATCNRTDSVKTLLSVIPPTEFSMGETDSLCLGHAVFLESKVNNAIYYLWSTGQTSPNIYVNQPGTYTLTIHNGGCLSSATVNVVLAEKKFSDRFPNVITPNGDQINDWIYFSRYDLEELEFIVYDRWGKERAKILNPYEKWEPNDLENGTYFYVASYKSSCTGKFAQDKGYISIFK
jgi:hypothetical protein